MSSSTGAPVGRDGAARWLRRRWPALAAAVVVAAVVVLVALFVGGDDGNASPGREPVADPTATAPTPTATESPVIDPPATPSPEVPTPDGTASAGAPPPSLPQVGLADTAAVGDGVSVSVVSVERIQGQATGPGNIAGPALRVTVRITNGTGADVALDGVTVNLAYGEAVSPAPALEDASRVLFGGTVAPGASAEGSYVFSVPTGAADPAVIEVGYRPGAPLVLFVGPVD